MLGTDIGYRLAHHEDLTWRPGTVVTDVTEGVVFEEGDVRVTATPTDHAPVHPTVGYRIDDGGSSVVIAGDTVPCDGLDRLPPGPTCWCTPWSAATRSRRWGCRGCSTSWTTTPPCPTQPGPPSGPAWAPWCSPRWFPPYSPVPSRSGSTRPPRCSGARWWWPRTWTPSRPPDRSVGCGTVAQA